VRQRGHVAEKRKKRVGVVFPRPLRTAIEEKKEGRMIGGVNLPEDRDEASYCPLNRRGGTFLIK